VAARGSSLPVMGAPNTFPRPRTRSSRASGALELACSGIEGLGLRAHPKRWHKTVSMSEMIPDFEAWAVFAKVAEHQSFAGAARALGLSGATVSKALSRLEARLGATLIHRTTRRLSLTPIGHSLVGRASALLSDGQDAENLAREEASGPAGLVRIAAPMSFGRAYLAPLLADLLDEMPGITIELDLDDAQTDLVQRGIDLALRIGWPHDSGLKSRKLAELHTWVVAAPDYIKRHGLPAEPAELSAHVTLAYAHLRPHDLWHLQNEAGETIKIPVRNLMVTNSGDAMLPLLCAGKAVALMPEFLIHEDIAKGRLVRLVPGWGYRPAGLYLMAPSSGPRPSRVTAVMDFLAGRMTGLTFGRVD
jgi:DNA-binding transcriptional LysR family regulator